jgi:hypothetical protein
MPVVSEMSLITTPSTPTYKKKLLFRYIESLMYLGTNNLRKSHLLKKIK